MKPLKSFLPKSKLDEICMINTLLLGAVKSFLNLMAELFHRTKAPLINVNKQKESSSITIYRIYSIEIILQKLHKIDHKVLSYLSNTKMCLNSLGQTILPLLYYLHGKILPDVIECKKNIFQKLIKF